MRGNFKIRRTKLHRDTSQERIDKIKEEYDKDNSNSKRSNSLKNRKIRLKPPSSEKKDKNTKI